MAKKKYLLQGLSLDGLELAPSQVWGAIRLVPLLRNEIRNDIRLTRRSYSDDLAVVALDGELQGKGGMKYFSFVPQGLVLSWENDSSPISSPGAQIYSPDGKRLNTGCGSVRLLHRMAKREGKNQLRFLPMHLSMEGFLSMFFSGPDIAWTEYSQYAISHGLGFRLEYSYMGRFIQGLEDALKVFEIHSKQVGVLVFVADALASAFVLPTPEDYRALHLSMLEDMFGELIYHYGCLYDTVCPIEVKIDEKKIQNFDDLRKSLADIRSTWASFQGFMAERLFQRDLRSDVVCDAGPFILQRFITDLNPQDENHMGEAIVCKDDRSIQYLKTYRLSAAQTRRVYLLEQLSLHNWNIDATAEKLRCSRNDLVLRIEKVGFGYLLSEQVRRAALKKH